jgi:hypothetical protein
VRETTPDAEDPCFADAGKGDWFCFGPAVPATIDLDAEFQRR